MAVRPTLRGRTADAGPRRAAPAAVRASRHLRAGGRALASALLAGVLAALLITAAACGTPDDGAAKTDIDVLAAASLTEAFTQLAGDFTAAHPGVTITLNFAGSNDLVTQMQQGAPADVFASADTATMGKAGDLVNKPVVFAANTLAIAVAPGNPEHIRRLADLSRSDLKVVLAAPEVPAGEYAAEILERAGVHVSPVSLEVSVKGVVTKIALGEADAGVVYVTDVAAADGKIEAVSIPDAENVVAAYPIAMLAEAAHAADAQAFIDLVLSAEGRGVLRDHGFLAPSGRMSPSP